MKQKVKINVEISGSERNVSELLKMIRYIQYLGGIGHSTDFKVWVDGDGAADIRMEIPSFTEDAKEDLTKQVKDRLDKNHDIKSFSFD